MNIDFNLQMVLLIGLNLVGFLVYLISEVEVSDAAEPKKVPVRDNPATFLFGEELPPTAESCRQDRPSRLAELTRQTRNRVVSTSGVMARNLRRAWSRGKSRILRGGGDQ